MFTISTKNAFPNSHLETGYSGKQAFIRQYLNLYLLHIQMKMLKAVKITAVRSVTARIAMADDPSSEMCCSNVI